VTYPHSPQPGPRPGPPPGPPPGYRPAPPQPSPADSAEAAASAEVDPQRVPGDDRAEGEQPRYGVSGGGESTGHPAVDAVLRSLANAAQLPPAEQIAEYEAAHRVLQETLSSIDG
jgi:hypothetical protein